MRAFSGSLSFPTGRESDSSVRPLPSSGPIVFLQNSTPFDVCPPAVATPLLDQGKETAWPKLMEMNEGDEITPAQVLSAVEEDLENGRFWVMVTGQTRFGAWMRRVLPNLVWKQVHKIEGW